MVVKDAVWRAEWFAGDSSLRITSRGLFPGGQAPGEFPLENLPPRRVPSEDRPSRNVIPENFPPRQTTPLESFCQEDFIPGKYFLVFIFFEMLVVDDS